ncbi:MAG: ATP-binding protein [Clostridia bacterium]|nr:ATP-binding protein [Clostridia bacterium]
MMKNRNSYLISRSLRRFLMASIATMAIVNINTIVDSVLMGQLISPEAVSAIQNVVPIMGLIAGITSLLSAGASIIATKALGRRDFDEASSSITVAVSSCLGFGLIVSLLTGVLAPRICSLLCQDPALYENTYKYLYVIIAGAFLMFLMNGTSIIVESIGYPRLVSFAMLSSVIVNLICDILYVKVFLMDISGAALATLTGSLIGVIALFVFLFWKRKMLGIRPYFRGFASMMGRNVVMGIPPFLGNLAITLLIFMCNYFVQSVHGETGVFVMSIGYAMVSLGQMISGGVQGAFLGIGGLLVAQRDYDGLRRLVKRGLAISCGFALLCFLAVLFVSDELAVLFGATDPATIRLTGQGLPLITTMNFSLSVILPLAIVYQINDHSVISTLSASSLLFGMGIAFILAKYLTGIIWVAFPIGTALSIAFVLLCSILVRRKAGGNAESVLLIPEPLDDTTRFDISVPCDRSSVGEAVRRACDFLSGKATHDTILHISLCMEELLLNYAEHSGKSQKAYMDISILCDRDAITLIVKDDGIPFDPIHAANEEMKAGLKVVQAFMSDASYSYSLGQNIVIMKWGQ